MTFGEEDAHERAAVDVSVDAVARRARLYDRSSAGYLLAVVACESPLLTDRLLASLAEVRGSQQVATAVRQFSYAGWIRKVVPSAPRRAHSGRPARKWHATDAGAAWARAAAYELPFRDDSQRAWARHGLADLIHTQRLPEESKDIAAAVADYVLVYNAGVSMPSQRAVDEVIKDLHTQELLAESFDSDPKPRARAYYELQPAGHTALSSLCRSRSDLFRWQPRTIASDAKRQHELLVADALAELHLFARQWIPAGSRRVENHCSLHAFADEPIQPHFIPDAWTYLKDDDGRKWFVAVEIETTSTLAYLTRHLLAYGAFAYDRTASWRDGEDALAGVLVVFVSTASSGRRRREMQWTLDDLRERYPSALTQLHVYVVHPSKLRRTLREHFSQQRGPM